MSNDTDVENDTLVVSAVTQGANGTVTFAGGSVTYTPNGNFSGSDSFTYTVSDGNGGTDTATVTVTVNPVNDNDPVITSANAANVAENSTSVLTVTATDADNPAQTVTYSISGGADSGKFAINGTTGELIFSAAPDYENPTDADTNNIYVVQVTASDGAGRTASQTINVTVNSVNDAPTGVPVINGTATEDQTLTADISGISDADGLGAFSYQWLRNGVVIAGATDSTYTLGDADVGAVITVVASYTDGQGTAETLTSAPVSPVTNVNDVPTGSGRIDTKTNVAEPPSVPPARASGRLPEPARQSE